MAKTLILTQEQLNEIIDGPYLTNDKTGDNIHLNEPSIEGGGVKEPKMADGMPPMTDTVVKMMGPPTNHWPGPGFGGRGSRMSGIPTAAGLEETYTKREFEKKMLNELNDQLNGIDMTAVIPNPSDPTNPTLITGSENMLSTQKNRAEQSGDTIKADAIGKTLDAQRNRISSGKKMRSQMGMPNQYQKPGGTRNNGGKAHTPKNNNMIDVVQPVDNN